MTAELTPELASRFARIALGHVTREYPHKLDHVLSGDADAVAPRLLHPAFHGSFDWHSCVHGFWLLARLRRRFPDLPEADAIAALFDARLAPGPLTAELAYLQRPGAGGFERPYGWAWLLALQMELYFGSARSRGWAEALKPLADVFAGRFRAFLPKATYPVRAGVHTNTAFALLFARGYGRAFEDDELFDLADEKAEAWYGADRDCQAWEPSQDEFLSPALMEALLMSDVYRGPQFAPWLAQFLPRLTLGEPATLFRPATVSDRSDGKIAHLDGLNLSRAWCFRGIAAGLPVEHPLQAVLRQAVADRLAASLPHVAGDYMGEHWLASFALLALDGG